MPPLNKKDLEHHERRIAGRASGRSVNWRKQSLERRPVERLLDPIQKPSARSVTPHHRVNERRLAKVTAGHRRIILSGPTPENQIRPLLQSSLKRYLGEPGGARPRLPRAEPGR
jgi:hypothetical protein